MTETTESTEGTENGLEYEDDKAYLTPPTDLQTMLLMDIYHFSPPSSYTMLQPIVQLEPEEEQSEVQSCCCTQVVVYTDDVVEIADDERSSSSESSSSDDEVLEDVPELESLLDQENVQPVPIPAPSERPPPYAMSDQRAVHTKGVPKSSFHPYPCDHRPLALLVKHSEAEARRFGGSYPSWRTTPTSPSYTPGGYGVGDSGGTSESERQPLGRRGGVVSSSSGGGDLDPAREEE